MGLGRETTVRIYTVFWPLMYNVSCTRDVTHTWVIATSELSSNIESIVKKKKKNYVSCIVAFYQLNSKMKFSM